MSLDADHYPERKMSKRYSRSPDGFTLIEMAVVLTLVAVTFVMFLQISPAMREAQNRQRVRTQLNVIDTALINFVVQNKRLPCPADGTAIPGAPIGPWPGFETLDKATGLCGASAVMQAQHNGVIPWVNIGLSQDDVTDPWNELITYRVDPQLTNNLIPLMNMTNCDPSGTAGTATAPVAAVGGCITPATTPAQSTPCIANPGSCTSPANFLANKGLDVWDTINPFANRINNRGAGTGAAYVTISHGKNVIGSYNATPTYQNVGNGQIGAKELTNFNNKNIALPTSQITAYVDAPLNDVPSAAFYFDDYLSHPTILSVLNAANLGPRAN